VLNGFWSAGKIQFGPIQTRIHYGSADYCHVVCSDYRRGFALVVGFIDHLYTRLGATDNYNVSADLHTLPMTTAPAKFFPAYSVFTSRSLATASNSGVSSASPAQVLFERQLSSN
jgi:hypothetical protein